MTTLGIHQRMSVWTHQRMSVWITTHSFPVTHSPLWGMKLTATLIQLSIYRFSLPVNNASCPLCPCAGVFLLCWVPFFVFNNLDAWNELYGFNKEGFPVILFPLTTWVGYMNSFLNPVIYTIFNPEFRKAFKRILVGSCTC